MSPSPAHCALAGSLPCIRVEFSRKTWILLLFLVTQVSFLWGTEVRQGKYLPPRHSEPELGCEAEVNLAELLSSSESVRMSQPGGWCQQMEMPVGELGEGGESTSLHSHDFHDVELILMAARREDKTCILDHFKLLQVGWVFGGTDDVDPFSQELQREGEWAGVGGSHAGAPCQ